MDLDPKKYRCFFVNDKFEFALFFDNTVTDKNLILSDFLNWKDWKFHLFYFDVEFVSAKFSDDLSRVDIVVKNIVSSSSLKKKSNK